MSDANLILPIQIIYQSIFLANRVKQDILQRLESRPKADQIHQSQETAVLECRDPGDIFHLR